MNRKLTKRTHITCVQSDDKCFQQHGYNGSSPIFTYHQWFALRWKHKKGSNRPEGWFHSPYGDIKVEIRWLWTEEHEYFAPEISFRPHRLSNKLVPKVAEALDNLGRHESSPDGLIEALGATVVQYADDNGKNGDCYDDYRPLRVPGEPAMVTLARYAL
jgi:hypothetical protein